MKAKALDTFIKVVSFFKRLFLTLFAGLLALSALGGLIHSLTEGGFAGVIGASICAFCAAVCWSIRKD